MSLGADGVLWERGGAVRGARPAAPTEVVDTTAAGDTVVGALAARLVGGDSFEVAMAWALCAASITVSRTGWARSIPHESEIRDRLASEQLRHR
ncbi:PfkB family carbohydrate kinase [Microbacterium oryzae]|uniref:PfkB family carbohydrate kinase n=1 Tax=Microbacterium oryzae TaxID=743009 RepID=UPI0025B0FE47|nr:PfkB family carbohydrate kinase [Microbacterium oryzae]MDN3310190.1 PfkB family carbohydrate kinase [Microbacterium oryzae]